MERLHNWPERLAAVLREVYARPFAWGEWDCVQFACRCIEAVTGETPLPADIAAYDSVGSAARQIVRYGHGLAEVCDAKFGQRIPPSCARRGDLLMDVTGCLGVAIDAHGFFVGAHGLENQPVLSCRHAWRIG